MRSLDSRRSRRSRRTLGTLALLCWAAAPPVHAGTTNWIAGTSNWATSGNWSNGLPTYDDNAYINNGGTAQVLSGYHYADDLYLGRYSGQSGHVSMSGGYLYVEHDQYIGYEGTGTFTQIGGENRVSAGTSNYDLFLGYATGGAGTYTMTGGTLYAGDEYIGRLGTGTFLQSGGINYLSATGSSTADNMYIGYATSSAWGSGTYRLSGTGQLIVSHKNADIRVGGEYGGTLSSGRLEWFREGGISWSDPSGNGAIIIGENATLALGYDFSALPARVTGMEAGTLEVTNGATVTKNDGINSVVKYLRIGSSTGAGYGNMSSGTVQVGQAVYIGDGGLGSTVQTGGTFTVTTHLYLGLGGAQGTYRLKGGSLNVGSSIYGGTGTGTLILDGGTLTVGGSFLNVTNLILGDETGRTGSYTLASGKTMNTADQYLGVSGTGNFTQSGGTANVGNLRFGTQASGVGTYLLSGGTLNVTGQVLDGPGTGTLQIDGSGTFNPSGSVTVDNLKVGIASAGSHTQSGQTYTVGTLTLGAGSYTLAGGTLNAGGVANTTGTGTLNIDGGVFSPTGAVNVDNLGVGIASAGSHTQSGQTYTVGTLTLGNATYRITGGTLNTGSVSNPTGTGTLNIDGGTFSPTGAVNVDNLGVGIASAGSHTQSGQTYTVGTLTLGAGTYTLSGGTLSITSPLANATGAGTLALNGGTFAPSAGVDVDNLHVGVTASAAYTQSAATWQVGAMTLGVQTGSSGTYTLAGGTLNVAGDIAAGAGTGTLVLNGGALNLGGGLAITHLKVGANASASYTQPAKTFGIAGTLSIGAGTGSGTYRLEGAAALNVGTAVRVPDGGGTGRLEWYRTGGLTTPLLAMQAGGTLAMGQSFEVGRLLDGSLFGGTLLGIELATLEITAGASARQTDVAATYDRLTIGSGGKGGTYHLESLSLNVGDLMLGAGGPGMLEVAPGAAVTIRRTLVMGRNATLHAAPGTVVTLTGSNVWNHSSNPDALADLLNVTLAFQPSSAGFVIDQMELAGRDLGPTMDGFDDNFALDALIVGEPGRDTSAMLVLTDTFRNLGPEPEALYLHNLYVHKGALLDLAGLNVYYSGEFLLEGKVINGMPQYIPEPSSLALAALGALALLRRRR
jgi:fibronectin-binding autotransporter adhesin